MIIVGHLKYVTYGILAYSCFNAKQWNVVIGLIHRLLRKQRIKGLIMHLANVFKHNAAFIRFLELVTQHNDDQDC